MINDKNRKLTGISDNIFTHSDEEILTKIELNDTITQHINKGTFKRFFLIIQAVFILFMSKFRSRKYSQARH